MSKTTYEFKAKLGYSDLSSKTYTLPVFQAEDIQPVQIMNRCKALNTALGGGSSTIQAANEYAAAMKQTFVSSAGASITKIISCSTVSTLEEVIYSG